MAQKKSPAKLLMGREIRRRLGMINSAADVSQGNLANTADPYKDINTALNTRSQVGAIENLPPAGGAMGIAIGEQNPSSSAYVPGTGSILDTGGPRSNIQMEASFGNPYFNNSPNAPRGGQRRANQMFGTKRSRQMCMNLGKIKK